MKIPKNTVFGISKRYSEYKSSSNILNWVFILLGIISAYLIFYKERMGQGFILVLITIAIYKISGDYYDKLKMKHHLYCHDCKNPLNTAEIENCLNIEKQGRNPMVSMYITPDPEDSDKCTSSSTRIDETSIPYEDIAPCLCRSCNPPIEFTW